MNKKILIIVTGIIFLISSVYITIEASASGAEMLSLQNTVKVLSGQKAELENALVSGVSSQEMASKSAELGFAKPGELMYLKGNENQNQALINTLSH